MFHCEKSLKTPPLSLKSPGILLKGLLLKVAILAIKKLKTSEQFSRVRKNIKKQLKKQQSTLSKTNSEK
jgi:hypothetical protein